MRVRAKGVRITFSIFQVPFFFFPILITRLNPYEGCMIHTLALVRSEEYAGVLPDAHALEGLAGKAWQHFATDLVI